MGGVGGDAIGVRTSQICVKNHGTRYKPQEGPSEEPEVQGHLRRVRGVFLSLLGPYPTTSHKFGISTLRILLISSAMTLCSICVSGPRLTWR